MAHSSEPSAGVAVVVPARDEAARVAAAVRAARQVPGVRHVVVVDDASLDATPRRAAEAGAHVLRHARGRGKAAALTTGAARIAQLDAAAGLAPSLLLFVDPGPGVSAATAAALVAPVVAGAADMTIAVPTVGVPPHRRPGGGHGLVARLSGLGIRQATGFVATQPLAGVRCLTRTAFDAARPLAAGWGVETALTIDLLLAGYRVLEVPCEARSDTGGGARPAWTRQLRDVAWVLVVRRTRRALPLRVLRAVRGVGRTRP